MSVRIRIASIDDAAGIRAVYAPYCEDTPVSFEAAPSVEQMAERIARVLAGYPWLVCEVEDSVAGYVYACPHRERAAYRWAVDVAVYIDKRYHRRGIGQALYELLFSLLRRQNYYKAYAGITLPNPGSVGLHEALGFQPVGVYRGVGYKLGRWRDVGWWQLELQPEAEHPHEPIPFRDLNVDRSIVQMLTDAQRLIRVP
jgi:phosphinothricin acetyltransferase